MLALSVYCIPSLSSKGYPVLAYHNSSRCGCYYSTQPTLPLRSLHILGVFTLFTFFTVFCVAVKLCALHIYMYSPLIKEHETLSDVLKAMEKTILPTSKEGNILPVEIRRDFLLVDALRAGRKAKFAANKYLRVSEVTCGMNCVQ